MGEPGTLCTKERRFNRGEEWEERVDTAKNYDRVAYVYWLSKAKQSNEERSIPLPVIDEMLERLANHTYFCFLDGTRGSCKFPFTGMINTK
jgi:hypothetical protein